MGNTTKIAIFWVAGALALLSLLGAVLALTWRGGLALRLADHYSGAFLAEEAITMDECAECHDGPDFHRCTTCHDDHGAVEFADLPFYNLIYLSGDVPRAGFMELNQILPYRDHPGTHLGLVDFLESQGVDQFESVTLISGDGGFVTITRENLSDQALLLPYADGIRFAAEDLHVSTWLKGITGIIVVGEDRPLQVAGEATSLGRLLLGPTRQVVVESARVMFKDDLDGQIREAWTASRVWGAALSDLAPDQDFAALIVRDQVGQIWEFDPGQIQAAVLAATADGPTLVFPGQPRSSWVAGVAALEWEE